MLTDDVKTLMAHLMSPNDIKNIMNFVLMKGIKLLSFVSSSERMFISLYY